MEKNRGILMEPYFGVEYIIIYIKEAKYGEIIFWA